MKKIYVNRQSGALVPEGYPNSECYVRLEDACDSICHSCSFHFGVNDCPKGIKDKCNLLKEFVEYYEEGGQNVK